ncbi:transcriptional regulator [Vallitalea longa]|uniref:Transcriptional regulator n=1 Tax=Vallitalea longa TaxID=2936439 RepID=A0A9W6DH94_9FIRM|nr:DUF2087 domain-containing protein [Vallitalea longa]GKX31218.1 transcriptional regulator [Vallitalea longa]
MTDNNLFWNASIDELKKGYIYDYNKDTYVCLICGKTMENGVIHEYNNQLLTCRKRMEYHIDKDHGGIFNFLISLNKKYTGLTDNQKEILECFYNDMNDKETAKKLSISQSTIRNYRFKLREKEKQAKIFTILMDLTARHSDSNKLVEPHKTATMIDDRYQITKEESEKIIKRYFTEEGGLKDLPSKEKRKIIVLRHIADNFKPNNRYSEKEINRIIKRIYDDYAIIRRYLIEYGFLDRTKDCTYYWVK